MMSMTCSKHVENYKYINTLKRICASSWTVTKNKLIEFVCSCIFCEHIIFGVFQIGIVVK